MTDSNASIQFPADFIWGTATSSYQIEGDREGRGENIWDRFCAEPGRIADGTDGAAGCDHVGRWREDVALMKSLNLKAYRFSIAWSRIMPAGKGPVDGKGVDFYKRLIDELLANGIEPYPTLYHWDLPTGLNTGWTERDTAKAFAEYASVTAELLGDGVNCWTTLNEPFVSAHHGYVNGEHAPGEQSWTRGLAAAHHLLLGHGLAVEAIRAARPGCEVGIVLNFTPTEPATYHPDDGDEAGRIHEFENRWFVEPIAGQGYPVGHAEYRNWDQAEILDGDLQIIAAPIDFLGINYYTRQLVAADPARAYTPTSVTDMGWEIHPQSFQDLLEWLHRDYGFARYLITENGAAMADQLRTPDGEIDDQDRIAYLRDHITALWRAMENGVPVDGYLVWSFLDNFEWAFGFEKTFGIVEVERPSMDRIPKASARWYGELAKSAKLTPYD